MMQNWGVVWPGDAGKDNRRWTPARNYSRQLYWREWKVQDEWDRGEGRSSHLLLSVPLAIPVLFGKEQKRDSQNRKKWGSRLIAVSGSRERTVSKNWDGQLKIQGSYLLSTVSIYNCSPGISLTADDEGRPSELSSCWKKDAELHSIPPWPFISWLHSALLSQHQPRSSVLSDSCCNSNGSINTIKLIVVLLSLTWYRA